MTSKRFVSSSRSNMPFIYVILWLVRDFYHPAQYALHILDTETGMRILASGTISLTYTWYCDWHPLLSSSRGNMLYIYRIIWYRVLLKEDHQCFDLIGKIINLVSFMINLLECLLIHSCSVTVLLPYFDNFRKETSLTEQNSICVELGS